MPAKAHESLPGMLAENVSAIMWSTDCELRVLNCRGHGLNRLNFCLPEQPVATELAEFFRTEGPDSRLIEAHWRALNGELASFEFQWAGRRFRGYVAAQQDAHQQLVGCVGFAQEITDSEPSQEVSRHSVEESNGYLGIDVGITQQKAAEEQLRTSQQRYRQLLEAITAYRYSVKLEGGVPVSTEHSPGCLAVTGYKPEEYASDPLLWIKMVHPDDREQVQRHVVSVLRNEALPAIEHRILRKDGTARWVRDTTMCHTDETGVLTGYDGLVEDITERKHLEERLQQLLESAPDATVVVNHEGQIVLANAQTERLFGFKREELFQQPIEVLVPERFRKSHSTKLAEYVAAPRTRLLGERELVGCRKDGTEVPVEISLSPIETQQGLLVVAAIRDISQRKRTEQALRSNLEIQSTLTSLLELSLRPLSLEEHLARTLDVLFSVSWVELESKGAIFLVEGDPPTLVMKAQRGLPDSLLAACRTIPFGRCLCGRAAATRQIVFSNRVDDLHEFHYAAMLPHGYYCVPVMWGDDLLGVITLYVENGHEQNPDEEAFLAAVANVLAGIIKRKRAEESLRESEDRFHLAVRGTDAGIWDWNLLTNHVYYSPRWKSMLGYEEDEIQHDYTEWERRVHQDDRDRALATIRDYLEGRTTEYELEHRLRHKDGSYRWILARGAAVRDQHGRPYRMVGSHLDITERKRSEQRLRQREAQLLAAQQIQEQLLPPRSPVVPGFDITGNVFPAEFAAGDYFDYLCLSDTSLGVVVADVTGHDVSSALLTASTCAHLRSFVEDHTDIREILAHTNSILCSETEEGRFVTLLFACLELQSRVLRYVNAGHPSGYVLGQSGDVKAVLQSNTLPLAVLPETDFPVGGPIQLETKDIVVLVTDGILEARSSDNELFGADRMLETVRANRNRKASEIIETLRQAVRDFTQREELLDDLTAVVIKVEPPSTASEV